MIGLSRLGSALVAVLALAPATALAAQDDRWQLTLPDERYVWDIRLVRLDGDSLIVRRSDSLLRVPVAQIEEIRLIRKSRMQVGDGATAGAMSALMGGDDEIYDFRPLDFADRLRAVQKILLLRPNEP